VLDGLDELHAPRLPAHRGERDRGGRERGCRADDVAGRVAVRQSLIGHVVQWIERHRVTVRQRHRGGDRVGAERPGLHRVHGAFKRRALGGRGMVG